MSEDASRNLALIQAALADSAEGVVLVDDEGQVLAASRAAASLLGVSQARLCSCAAGLAPFSELLSRALRGEETTEVMRTGSGTLSVRAQPLRAPAGGLVGAALRLSAPPAQLSDDERVLRTFIEIAPGPAVAHRTDGRIVLANSMALAAFGCSSLEELRGCNVLELLHPDDRARAAEHQRRLLLGEGREESRGLTLRRRNGGVVQLITTVLSIDFEGAPTVLVLAIDLSEMRKADVEREQLLEEARRVAMLREKILESIAEGVWVLDARGGLVYANSAGCRLLGAKGMGSAPKTAAEVDARICYLTAEGATFEPGELPLARALRGETFRSEMLMLTPEASHHVELICAPLPSEDGAFGGAVAVLHDLTEAKKSEHEREELRRLAERRAAELESILLHIADAVLVCDPDGRLALANAAARQLLRLPAEPEGTPVADLLRGLRLRRGDGRLLEPHELPMSRALRDWSAVREDRLLVDVAGRTLDVRASAAPVVDEHGELLGAVTVLRDVTELSELERLKNEFLSVAAHELKTPVTVVKGYAQAMRRSGEPLGKRTEFVLSAIDRGAERIAAIVQDLVDISQLDLGRMELANEPIDLGWLVMAATALLAPGTAARVRRAGAERARVLGDADGLTRVVLSLLDNAARYSAEDSPIDLDLAVEGSEAVLTVRDHGVGIPLARQARIFERFYRAHTDTPHDHGGIGVRLYLSREIVRRHGGSMGFISREGEGSSFFVRLPLAR